MYITKICLVELQNPKGEAANDEREGKVRAVKNCTRTYSEALKDQFLTEALKTKQNAQLLGSVVPHPIVPLKQSMSLYYLTRIDGRSTWDGAETHFSGEEVAGAEWGQ